MDRLERFEIEIPEATLGDLRARLARARWPVQPEGLGWEMGADLDYIRELCDHWADGYDKRRIEQALNGLSNWRWEGIHVIWERAPSVRRDAGAPEPLPILLIHGWPGGVIEFLELIPRLVAAGHDVIIPSLPGFGFSDPLTPPLNVAGVADRLRGLMRDGLGYDRYAVQGGDWGAIIGARMGFDDQEAVAALHLNSPGVLPVPGDLSQPPLVEAEREWLRRAQRWRTREGFHLLVQGAAPDALAVGLSDSPAGLAAWLVEKYRRWSDCDGQLERRFSKDELCDFLTLYWATGTIAPSMRLYAAEARDRWRLAPGERIDVPAAVADFPAEIIRPPREWTGRLLGDLQRWTEFERGGHFAAFEEPALLGDDLLAFLNQI